jgi:prepilin-type N-terminal cleavage/methylation domain-containing protein
MNHTPTARRRGSTSGITLIEMLIVVGIVSIVLAIAFPNVTSGLDGIRLKTAVDRVGSFWSAARQRADRFQSPVQVTVDPQANELRAASVANDWSDSFDLSNRLHVTGLEEPQRYLLYPGAPSPDFRLMLESESGGKAGIKVNVFTGVPEDWDGDVQK